MVEERIERLKEEGHDAVVVEAALLVEAGWETLVDEVWMTTSPEDTVVQRLRSRDNMDERAIRARALSQMPQAERVKHSDVVIDNGGSLLQLRDQVIRLWKSRDHRAER